MDALDMLKTFGNWAWVPFGAFLSFKQQSYMRNLTKQDELNDRIYSLEKNNNVNTVQIEGVKEMVKDVKDEVKEVRAGVDRLIDKLI